MITTMDFSLLALMVKCGLLKEFGFSDFHRYQPFNGTTPGRLGLPIIGISNFPREDNFYRRVGGFYSHFVSIRHNAEKLAPQLQYHSGISGQEDLRNRINIFIESNQKLTSLFNSIDNDDRVLSLKDSTVFNGSGGLSFSSLFLQHWILWRANEIGLKEAWGQLNNWLNSDRVEIVCALWVYGFVAKEEFTLADGFAIVPSSSLPDSSHKEYALQHSYNKPNDLVPFPATAIIKNVSIKKIVDFHQDNPAEIGGLQYADAQSRLFDIALLINAIQGINCVPAFTSSYYPDNCPIGPFGGDHWGHLDRDIISRKRTEFHEDNRGDLQRIISDFDKLGSDGEKERFRHILNRFSQAKRRAETSDTVLDLGIALEMLLLADNGNHEQLSLTFKLRGSWLVSKSFEERKANYALLGEIYKYRSQVAHTGLLQKGDNGKIELVKSKLPAYLALAEKICRQAIHKSSIDWNKLVLGGDTEIS